MRLKYCPAGMAPHAENYFCLACIQLLTGLYETTLLLSLITAYVCLQLEVPSQKGRGAIYGMRRKMLARWVTFLRLLNFYGSTSVLAFAPFGSDWDTWESEGEGNAVTWKLQFYFSWWFTNFAVVNYHIYGSTGEALVGVGVEGWGGLGWVPVITWQRAFLANCHQCTSLPPQWGNAVAKMKVTAAENPKLLQIFSLIRPE